MIHLDGLERIGEGRLATVYKLEGNRLLKVFKWPGVAEYEFRQTMAAWMAGVSRQRPHEITTADGIEAIVSDYLPGVTLMSRIDGDKPNVLRYIRQMADCHGAIVQGVSDALPKHKDGLAHAIGHAPHLEESQRASLLEGLQAMPEGNHVLHGDLHPMNILIDGAELFAIDWMTASRGDPAADIARSYFIVRHSAMREDRNVLDMLLRNLLHNVLGGTYLRRVCKVTAVGRKEVFAWLPYIAAGRLTEDRPQSEVKAILRIVRSFAKAAI